MLPRRRRTMRRVVVSRRAFPPLLTKLVTLILPMFCASDRHVYVKFVGSSYEYIEWSIWVPKTLVANIKGPITKWVPKTKH